MSRKDDGPDTGAKSPTGAADTRAWNSRLALSWVILPLLSGCDGLFSPAPSPPPSDDGTDVDETPASCGGAGEPCCSSGVCDAGFACDDTTQTCEVLLACRGPYTYAVGVVSSETRCPITIVTQAAATPLEADLCVRASLPITRSTVPIGSVVSRFEYCLTSTLLGSSSTVSVEAFSAADARVCVNQQCLNCTVAAVPGPCP
jgi:hypothetical protein